MSVSVIGSLIANINSDSDTESTSETTSVDSSSEFCPTPLKKLRTAAGPECFYAKPHSCNSLLTKSMQLPNVTHHSVLVNLSL